MGAFDLALGQEYVWTVVHYTVEHSCSKPEFPGLIFCYKQEFVISGQFPMRYCSTWLRSLLCYIRNFVIEEFVIRVFHCTNHMHEYVDYSSTSLVSVLMSKHTLHYISSSCTSLL